MRHLVCHPNAEVIGAAVLGYVENARAEEIHPYLVAHGLENVEVDQWYKLQDWLDVLNDMADRTDYTSELVAIGMEIYRTIELPPEVEKLSYEDILMGWDAAYQAQHRGADVGHVYVEKVKDNHYRTTIAIPYPSDMIYGVAYGMAKRFAPEGTHYIVKYDPDCPRWEEGGDATVLHIILS